MTSKELHNIIQAGESETLEFKSSFNAEAIETLVEFSNTKGGSVYIGITDKGDIKGVPLQVETIQQWLNEIKTKTFPQIIPECAVMEVDNKTLVLLTVIEYPIKPVHYKNKYFKRKANSNHLMNIAEISNEHLKTINSSWDFYPDPNHSIDKISIDKIKKFIKKIEARTGNEINTNPLKFLEKLEFLRGSKLTFGAYLLFVNDYCPISDVQVGRFKSEIAIIDSISLNSDLFSEVEEIIAFIKKHLMVEFIITGNPQHEERFDYPLNAIREIVVNMVVHRDYRDSSGSIIKIFDNRIEFYNPGKLFGDITIKDLISNNYSSKVRNKLIAHAFKEVGIIEKYGSGVKRIFDICNKHGIAPPVFKEEFNGLSVILFKEKLKVTVEIADNVTEKVGEKVGENLTRNQLQIIKIIIKNNRVSARELAAELNISTRKVEQNIALLKEKGLLKRIGPDKGGYWEVNNE